VVIAGNLIIVDLLARVALVALVAPVTLLALIVLVALVAVVALLILLPVARFYSLSFRARRVPPAVTRLTVYRRLTVI